jgi:hypothetical protein
MDYKEFDELLTFIYERKNAPKPAFQILTDLFHIIDLR